MLAAIVRKEFANHVLTLRFAVGAIFTVVLFSASALVLGADYADRVEAYHEARGAHRQAMTEARVFSQLRVEADRAPAPLSVLCQGVDRALPSSSAFSITAAPTLAGAGAARNPLLVVFPSLDLAVVVQVVMSLLALLFAYDTVSGERARGTLALTLSHSVPRSTVLVGKYLGGMAVLLPLLAVGMGISLAVVASSPLVAFGGAEWAAAAVIFLASAAYLSAIFLLGMVLSVLTSSPGTSLVAGLFVWVVLVLLAPQAASATANAMRPLPSAREQAAAEGQVERGFARAMSDYARAHPLPLTYQQQRFNVDRRSLHSGGIPYLGTLYSGPREYVEWALAGTLHALPLRREAATRIAAIRQEAVRRMRGQVDLARALRSVSPASAYYDALTVLADTDATRYLRFREAVERYRRTFLEWAESRGGLGHRFFTRDEALRMPSLAELERLETNGEQARLRSILGTGFGDEPALDLSGMPEMALHDRSLGERVVGAGSRLLTIVVLNMLLLLAGALAFARADVRVR